MPITKCQKGGTVGFKWGDAGVCFTGSDGRSRAAAVGRAIHAREAAAKKGENTSACSNSEIESYVGAMSGAEVCKALARLPFHPDELRESWVRKADDELHLIWAEVYIPDIPDTQNEFMRAEEIQKMAHKFLALGKTGQVDVAHDNVLRDDVNVVESFIARKGDPEFIEGAWVVCAQVLDLEIWEKIKTGELNGLSMQAKVRMKNKVVSVDLPEHVSGKTQVSSDGGLHRHEYTVGFDEKGVFKGGYTDVVQGHRHQIVRRSITGPEVTVTGQKIDGSAFHRYTLLDQIAGLSGEESPGYGKPGE